MKNNHHQLIIIGSGPAGLTAGIYSARARLAPLIIEGPTPGGQLIGTTAVENWPGHTSILGPDLIRSMHEHAAHAGAVFTENTIESIDAHKRPFELRMHRGDLLTADALIICSGASPRRLKCPGEDEYWGKGVTTCAVCDAALYKDRKVMVVGGGDTAMESVLSLSQYTHDITLVQILDHLTASAAMQERVKALPFVKVVFEAIVTAIEGDDKRVSGVRVRPAKGEQPEQAIAVDGLFLAIGHRPNSVFLQNSVDLDEFGYIRTFHGTHTSVEGIFAAGDVMDNRYCQAITSAGTGCMAALDAERFLRMGKS